MVYTRDGSNEKGPISWQAAMEYRVRSKADRDVTKMVIRDEFNFREYFWER